MVGRLLGTLFGWLVGQALGAPWFGAFVGLWLGGRFDRGLRRLFTLHAFTHHGGLSQQAFTEALFGLLGHLAKSDGHVSSAEIHVANVVMDQCRLKTSQRQEAQAAFRRGKHAAFAWQQAANVLASACRGQWLVLHTVLDALTTMANTDPNPIKMQRCQAIAAALGLQPWAFNPEGFSQQQHRGTRTSPPPNTSMDLDTAYQLLGVQRADSFKTIQRAYRKLLGANHPDRLMAQNASEAAIKAANIKTQRLKKAYQLIQAHLGA